MIMDFQQYQQQLVPLVVWRKQPSRDRDICAWVRSYLEQGVIQLKKLSLILTAHGVSYHIEREINSTYGAETLVSW